MRIDTCGLAVLALFGASSTALGGFITIGRAGAVKPDDPWTLPNSFPTSHVVLDDWYFEDAEVPIQSFSFGSSGQSSLSIEADFENWTSKLLAELGSLTSIQIDPGTGAALGFPGLHSLSHSADTSSEARLTAPLSDTPLGTHGADFSPIPRIFRDTPASSATGY